MPVDRVLPMQVLNIKGYVRLGIVMSGFWVLLSACAYFLGIYLYPSSLTNALSKLYTWVEGSPMVDRGIDFTPYFPLVNSVRLTLFVGLPPAFGWTVFCIIPRSFRWVRDGFQSEHKPEA